MKHLKMVALGCATALVWSALVAASASATVEWQLQAISVGFTMKVKSGGTLKLTDSKVKTLGSITVECTIVDEGTVGKEGVDEITSISAEGCKGGELCKKPTAKPIGLPWKTQLAEVGGRIDDEIKAEKLGWSIECEVSKVGNIVDECTTKSTNTEVVNVLAGVEAKFSEKVSGKSKCTQSKEEETGTVVGTDTSEGGEMAKLEAV